ncbi:MAG: hypothetical protein J5746_12235 [Victivallales bacterium]|nr:hypothetical protein [Victivallales bacterium]
MPVYTYAGYELTKQKEEFEYRRTYSLVGGIFSQMKRRSVITMTWEATLTDASPYAPAAYNHDQGYPGSQNPGNLREADGWRLYSVDYGKSLSQPMSKVVYETWVKTGPWQTITE